MNKPDQYDDYDSPKFDTDTFDNDNSRMFDAAKVPQDSNPKIIFEYRNYLTSEKMNKKTNLLLYVIEKGDKPYIYYLMNKINDMITLPSIYLKNIKQVHEYMNLKFEKSKYDYTDNILTSRQSDFSDEVYENVSLSYRQDKEFFKMVYGAL